MEAIIYLSQVTPSTLTRLRGEVAGKVVAARTRVGAVELDFSGTLPSLSFLDGLILTLQSEQALQLVTFVTGDSRVHSRLVRISGERGTPISLRSLGQKSDGVLSSAQRFELDDDLEHARTQSKFAQI